MVEVVISEQQHQIEEVVNEEVVMDDLKTVELLLVFEGKTE
jgi:hypothetical protein